MGFFDTLAAALGRQENCDAEEGVLISRDFFVSNAPCSLLTSRLLPPPFCFLCGLYYPEPIQVSCKNIGK
jgi:hypothetical protein